MLLVIPELKLTLKIQEVGITNISIHPDVEEA